MRLEVVLTGFLCFWGFLFVTGLLCNRFQACVDTVCCLKAVCKLGGFVFLKLQAWELVFFAWLFFLVCLLGFSFVLCNRQAACCFLRIQAWNRLQCFNRLQGLRFTVFCDIFFYVYSAPLWQCSDFVIFISKPSWKTVSLLLFPLFLSPQKAHLCLECLFFFWKDFGLENDE